jgi:N-methylhydantoinase B
LGGREGKTNQTLIKREGKEEILPGKFSHQLVRPGEILTFVTGGGGGYGEPSQRDPAAVERDIVLGYVSKEGARENYSDGDRKPQISNGKTEI